MTEPARLAASHFELAATRTADYRTTAEGRQLREMLDDRALIRATITYVQKCVEARRAKGEDVKKLLEMKTALFAMDEELFDQIDANIMVGFYRWNLTRQADDDQ